jgi:hypothetical protein
LCIKTVWLRKPYQEHERREEEKPKVVRFTVREGGLFEHATVAHAVLSENMRHEGPESSAKNSYFVFEGPDSSQEEEVEDKV